MAILVKSLMRAVGRKPEIIITNQNVNIQQIEVQVWGNDCNDFNFKMPITVPFRYVLRM